MLMMKLEMQTMVDFWANKQLPVLINQLRGWCMMMKMKNGPKLIVNSL